MNRNPKKSVSYFVFSLCTSSLCPINHICTGLPYIFSTTRVNRKERENKMERDKKKETEREKERQSTTSVPAYHISSVPQGLTEKKG